MSHMICVSTFRMNVAHMTTHLCCRLRYDVYDCRTWHMPKVVNLKVSHQQTAHTESESKQ